MYIGTFARCGSGQDTLADSICHYLGFHKYSLGDVIREIAKERNLPEKRDVLQSIRVELDEKYGRQYIPRLVLNKICENSNKNIIITGIRTVEEYTIFNRELDMRLIYVYADEDERFRRMLKRNEQKDEGSIQELRLRMERENELFDYQELQEYAYISFDFNMPLEEYKQNEYEIVMSVYRDLRGDK